MSRTGRGKGNNYLALLNEAKRLKFEEDNKDSENSREEEKNDYPDFEDVMRNSTPADISSEYDWFYRNLPDMLECAQKEIDDKVRHHMRVKHNRELLGRGDERVSKDRGASHLILQSLSIKVGMSLTTILAPPIHHCLLCKQKLLRSNPLFTQVVLHTLDGPELATKLAYECQNCKDIYTFRGKFESNTRIYYQVGQFGNPSMGFRKYPTSFKVSVARATSEEFFTVEFLDNYMHLLQHCFTSVEGMCEVSSTMYMNNYTIHSRVAHAPVF